MSTQTDKKEEKPAPRPGDEALAKMTPEELELNRSRFLSKFGFGENPDAASEAEEARKKKEAEEAEAAKAKETPPEPEAKPAVENKEKEENVPETPPAPKPAKKPRKAKEVSTEEIVKTAAETAAEVVVRTAKEVEALDQPKTDQPAPKPEEKVEYAPDAERLSVYRFLESKDKSLAGLGDRFVDFLDRAKGYRDQWLKENPGQEFDPNDPAHDDFYADMPVVPEDVYHRAERDMIVEEASKPAREATKRAEEAAARLDRIEFDKRLEKEFPSIKGEADKAVRALVASAAPELAKLIEKDGAIELGEESSKKIQEEDPAAYAVLDEEANKASALICDYEMLLRFPKAVKFDPSREVELSDGTMMATHRELVRILDHTERELSAMPKDETDRDGKHFMPFARRQERLKSISESRTMTEQQRAAAIRDLNRNYWTLEPDDVRAAIVAEGAERASRRISQINDSINRRIGKLNPAASKTAAQPEKPQPPKPPGKTVRSTPPSVAAASDKTNAQNSGKNGTKTQDQIIDEKVWGIR